jgi:hypothetical protein
MKKHSFKLSRLASLITFSSIALLFGLSASAAPKAFVYKGYGACTDGCHQAAYQMALKAGFDPVYVGPHDQVDFSEASLWLQPGGHSSQVMTTMDPAMQTALNKFVENGGAYVGFCAGAFSATKLVGTTNINGFGIFPGLTTLYDFDAQAGIIPTQWNGKQRYVYWEGGPYISEIPAGLAEATAFYPNGQIAAARSSYGKGKVYITGMHPEAPQEWRDFYGLNDPDGDDSDLAVEMINWATGK